MGGRWRVGAHAPSVWAPGADGLRVEHYAKFERGNSAAVSSGVLEAVARALQLDDAERAPICSSGPGRKRCRHARTPPAPPCTAVGPAPPGGVMVAQLSGMHRWGWGRRAADER